MSPQIHMQLSSCFPYDFAQKFRAVVFLGHGLIVAIFVGKATVAAVGMWRARTRVFGMSGAPYTTFLLLILILCKFVGALILAIVEMPKSRAYSALPSIDPESTYIQVVSAGRL